MITAITSKSEGLHPLSHIKKCLTSSSYVMFTILFFTLSFGANAKEKEFRVMTHLEDSFTRERIGGKAVIMKSDSTILYEVLLSGSWGESAIPSKGEPGDTVIYKFLSEGYIPVTMNFIIPEKGKMPLKKIEKILLVKDKVKKLDEVTVKTSKVKMVMKGDTLVYNADAFELSNGSMLDALIARLPGAELKDGIIKVNGEFISELLLNGESFFKGDANIALQNLPAFTVKNLKVYRKDHESAYLTGGSKDKKSLPLVMDVILKRDYATGWIGNAEAGYGIPGNRWMGRAFLLGFADNLRVTAFGNGNNINNTTTAGTEGKWENNGKEPGENRIVKEGIDYLFHNKNTIFKFTGNVTLSHIDNGTDTEVSARNFIPEGGDTWERARTNSTAKDFLVSSNHRMTVTAPRYFLELMPKIRFSRNRFHSLNNTAVFDHEPYESRRLSTLDSCFSGVESPSLLEKLAYRYADAKSSSSRWLDGGLGASVTFKLPYSSDNIKLWMNGNARNDHYDLLNSYATVYPHVPSLSEESERSRNQKKETYDFNLRISYNQFNFKTFKLFSMRIEGDAGFDCHSGSDDNSWYNLLEQTSSRQAFIASLDPENSYWQRDISNAPWAKVNFRFYNGWSSTNGNIKTSGSLYYDLSLKETIKDERLKYNSPIYRTELHRTLNYLQPSLDIHFVRTGMYQIGNIPEWFTGTKNDFKFNYSYTDEAPPISYSLDYRRSPNPLNVYLPNTNLVKSKLHNMTFEWHHTGMKQDMMEVYSYLRIRPDALVQARFYDRETGVSTWMPDNISGNWDSYVDFKLTKPITKNRKLFLSSSTFFLHRNNVDYVSTSNVPERSKVVNNIPGESLKLSWQHKNIFLEASLSAQLHTARSGRSDFTDLNLWLVKPAFSTTIPLPCKIQLSSNLNVEKRYGFSDPNLRKAEILWNAELSRSFVNDRLLVKLRAYDILGRVNPNTTVVNAQAVTETFTNTLTRYVMLSISYNFNKNPKKK